MAIGDAVHGDIRQAQTPHWAPLLDLVGEAVTAGFMWMYEVALADGRRVQAYKHVATRRYVHLDGDGNGYAYVGAEQYLPAEAWRLFHDALEPWWRERLYPYTPAEAAAARRAVGRLRTRSARSDGEEMPRA